MLHHQSPVDTHRQATHGLICRNIVTSRRSKTIAPSPRCIGSSYPLHYRLPTECDAMPIIRKKMRALQREYGKEKGERVYYALETMKNPLNPATFKPGDRMRATYSNAGVKRPLTVTFKGFTTNRSGSPQFRTLAGAKEALGARTMAELGDEGLRMVVRIDEDRKTAPFFYIHRSRWVCCSGADRVTFTRLPKTSR